MKGHLMKVLLAAAVIGATWGQIGEPVKAQTPVQIAIGDVVEGMLTEAEPKVQYQFSGKEGDFVAIVVAGLRDDKGAAIYPGVKFTGPDKMPTDKDYPRDKWYERLKGDGVYTLEVGLSSQGVGKFLLELRPIPEIKVGESAEGKLLYDVKSGRRSLDYYRFTGDQKVRIEIVQSPMAEPDKFVNAQILGGSWQIKNNYTYMTGFLSATGDYELASFVMPAAPDQINVLLIGIGATRGSSDDMLTRPYKVTISAAE